MGLTGREWWHRQTVFVLCLFLSLCVCVVGMVGRGGAWFNEYVLVTRGTRLTDSMRFRGEVSEGVNLEALDWWSVASVNIGGSAWIAELHVWVGNLTPHKTHRGLNRGPPSQMLNWLVVVYTTTTTTALHSVLYYTAVPTYYLCI